MVLTRRQATSSLSPSASTLPASMSEITPLLPKTGAEDSPHQSRTISYEESLRILPWQTDNDYIRHGYRRPTPSIRSCLWSAVRFLHNETVNIHSHSIGAIFFAVLLPLHLIPSHFPTFSHFPDCLQTPPTVHDKVALTLYLVCAVSCLSLSSWFHTVSCHSKDVCEAAHQGDYMGIVILIVGSITPGMYYGFYDSLILQVLYMTAFVGAGVTSAYIVLSPHHRAHRWHRTLTFIGLGLSAVIPIGHVLIAHGFEYARQTMCLDMIVAGGACYIVGALLYAARLPEKLSPGTFDYIGSSHQIFHLFVLAGAWFQYAALRGMVWGRGVAMGRGV